MEKQWSGFIIHANFFTHALSVHLTDINKEKKVIKIILNLNISVWLSLQQFDTILV